MSPNTRSYVEAFWAMIDELLNAILFLLIGLVVFGLPGGPRTLALAAAAVPIVLLARLLSVGLPIAAMSLPRRWTRGLIPVLTWGGLRGGLSVAMVLSLPAMPAKNLFLACTYAVVVSSILVQAPTMRRLLARYGFKRA